MTQTAMATKEREKTKRTDQAEGGRMTQQRRREPPWTRQAMEDTDGGLHPAVDGQRLTHEVNPAELPSMYQWLWSAIFCLLPSS